MDTPYSHTYNSWVNDHLPKIRSVESVDPEIRGDQRTFFPLEGNHDLWLHPKAKRRVVFHVA